MRNLFTTIVILISISLNSQTLIHSTQVGDLKIGFNKNAELLGFAYFLGYESVGIETDTMEIGGIPIPKKEWHAYGYAFSQKFADFGRSENLQTAFALADQLWLDTLLYLLLQLEDAPNARIPKDMDPSNYIGFSKSRDPEEALRNVTVFLEGFNAFYQEMDFDRYLEDSRVYYETAREEIVANLPHTKFIPLMEEYFSQEFNAYTLVPSLTIPKGMGFGLNLGDYGVFNIFGAVDYQNLENVNSLSMGFANPQKLRELSIHEFGHSFVNPIVDRKAKSALKETEHLFEPIRETIYQQGYNTWEACITEHFVRGMELYISERYDTSKAHKELFKQYVDKRQFIYIPIILEELRKADRRGGSFDDAVESSMKRLQAKTFSAGG